MMRLPTDAEIESLHRKYAPNTYVLGLVLTHCRIVCDVAEQLFTNSHEEVNWDLVRVGCLLHDIGVYEFFDEHGHELRELPYITHGVRGESILRREGLAGEICRMASHHTGTGLTKVEIVGEGLPLPQQDFLAETLEEELVMYADKFHSKSKPPFFNSYAWYLQHAAQFGAANAAKFDELAGKFGVPDLAPLVKRYGYSVRELP